MIVLCVLLTDVSPASNLTNDDLWLNSTGTLMTAFRFSAHPYAVKGGRLRSEKVCRSSEQVQVSTNA